MSSYLFTSESVSEGHPDKISDQISDAILDEYLRNDPDSKIACETLVTTGLVVCAGEIRSNKSIDYQKVIRDTILNIGYNKTEYQFDGNSCGIISTLHKQSDDIYQGVNRDYPEQQGAGDQGIMFGYAIKESHNYMPLTLELSHLLLKELSSIRKEGEFMKYLRPDSKSQVTIEYDENRQPIRIDTIVISTQHDDNVSLGQIYEDIINILIPRVINLLPKNILHLFNQNFKLLVNPTGKFVIGGPHGDTGLTGRKIIVDTYGGRGAHGGGAFCLSYDTLVKTDNGYRMISEIGIGDNVYTLNEKTKEIELRPVLYVFKKSKNESDDLMEIEMDNGEKIKITENHEVYLKNGKSIMVKKLKPGFNVFDFNMGKTKIKNIKKIDKERTYDLSIYHNHNYFIGKSEILVHNSGKDSSKVDRSAAYIARYLAKNLVASNVAKEVLVQIAYAIGVAEPVGFYVNTYGTGIYSDDIIADKLKNVMDLRPYSIIKKLGLKNPIYLPTSSYGHFGRESYEQSIKVNYLNEDVYIKDGEYFKDVVFFPWEKLDLVDELKKIFNI